MNNEPDEKWFQFEEVESRGIKMLIVIVRNGSDDPDPRYYPVEQFFPASHVRAQLGNIGEPPL